MKTKALRETAVPFFFGHLLRGHWSFAARSLVISLRGHWSFRCAVISHLAALSLVISVVYAVCLR
jgi:hypothetical protein